jgi:tRNA A-37 threonylcarbamoyl transferase component Bud32
MCGSYKFLHVLESQASGLNWDARMSAQPGTGLIGTVLGGSYRITRLIGQGGMGAVYEGVQLRLERRVAVKLMARELSANAEAIARFRREAEVTSQLGHPHIVQVFDFGEAPTGEPYLVMEYLEGEDLERRIARIGKMSAPAASHIIRQVASALSATHAKGIVHRDLKPANVFLLSVEGETDFVKVVDFGISKVRAAGTKLTAALAVMGTPNYMAPEQAEGRIDEIDHRTDQWALACIAYELLAGRPPFIGENVASLLYQVIHQAPSPLASMNPGLPSQVEDVLRRALSKTQVGRFSTMTEFSRAFEGAATGKAVSVSAPPPDAGAAIGRAPTMVSSPSIPPVTTFSSAAGETGASAAGARPKRRGLLMGVATAVVLGGGAYAFVARRAGVPETPVSAAAIAVPVAASAAAAASPPAAPARAAPAPAATPDAGAAPAAATTTSAPAKRSRRSSRAASTAGAAPAPVAAAASPSPPTAPPPPEPEAVAAKPPPARPAPAWPPPAWPPPQDSSPQQPQQKRPGLFKRMLR